MRFGAVATEAWLNLRSGTSRGVLWAALLTVILVVLTAFEVFSVGQLQAEATAFRAAGGTLLTYTAQGEIDGARCDAISKVPSVVGAGAIRAAPANETAIELPSTTIPTFDVSPTFGGFTALGSPPANQGVLISDELAAALHLQRGSTLRLQSGNTRVAGVYGYPQDGRAPGYGYAIMIPTDTEQAFDQCWVESWPTNTTIEGLLTAVLTQNSASGTGPTPVLAQLNSSLGQRFDGSELFANRLSRFAPLVAVLAGVLLGLTSIRLRRLELSSARHAGVSARAMIVQTFIETLAWVVVSMCILLAASTIAAATSQLGPAGLVEAVAAHVYLLGGAGALVGAIAATAATSPAQLFRYFKER